MSLVRLIYYGAIIGGWAAFAGWAISEVFQARLETRGTWTDVLLTGALVGAALGAGLSIVAGMANTQWKRQVMRMAPGLAVGAVGGTVGGLVGNFVYTSLKLPQALGWMILGGCIGVVEGLTERTWTKTRNGLIGGVAGGLIGGFLMPVMGALPSRTGLFGRALAFVVLGLCIGAMVALVKVVLRAAWLTVEDGYRPGRQVILSERVTVLGRGELVALPFFSRPGQDLEPEHARVVRQADGHYDVEDNRTRIGTSVNGKPVHGRAPLKDNDVIKLGVNIVRFRERHPQPDVAPVPAAPAARAAAPQPAAVATPPRPTPAASPAPRPAVAPAPAAGPVSIGKCPQCGRRYSGVAGQRTCTVCHTTF